MIERDFFGTRYRCMASEKLAQHEERIDVL